METTKRNISEIYLTDTFKNGSLKALSKCVCLYHHLQLFDGVQETSQDLTKCDSDENKRLNMVSERQFR